VKLGVQLRYIRGDPKLTAAVAREADELGFESVWIGDRLIMPTDLFERLDDAHASLRSTTSVQHPAFDNFAYLSFLAAHTTRLRLGVGIWQMALRHPFVAARAIQTLDVLSEGRAEIGVGAGWLSSEFEATQVDFASRGRRLDETIAICQRLWTEEVVDHEGEFFRFGPVTLQPKPVQTPWPPLHAGGQSPAALRRAARLNGWYGASHTPESVRPFVEQLRALRALGDGRDGADGRDDLVRPFDITVRTSLEGIGDLGRWEDAGVTRLFLQPWAHGQDPLVGLRRFAERYDLGPQT
jgi:probable F420-dependent oxidoreductase